MSFQDLYTLQESFDSLLSFFKNSVFPYAVIFILLGVILGMWYYIVLKRDNPNLDLSISPFNRSIITIAVIFLVILILGMWYIFSKGTSNIKFPPMVSNCPDYWELGNIEETVNRNYGTGNKDYRGTANVTKSGLQCQRWDSQEPHNHDFTKEKFPNAGLNENFCRNPDNHTNVWCYTKDPNKRWEECNISLEKKVNKTNVCINKKQLGNGCKMFDPKDPKYHGPQGKIEKCKWAKNCGIVWDGITTSEKC